MALEQPRESRGQIEQNLPVTVTSGGNVQGEGSDYAGCGGAGKKERFGSLGQEWLHFPHQIRDNMIPLVRVDAPAEESHLQIKYWSEQSSIFDYNASRASRCTVVLKITIERLNSHQMLVRHISISIPHLKKRISSCLRDGNVDLPGFCLPSCYVTVWPVFYLFFKKSSWCHF